MQDSEKGNDVKKQTSTPALSSMHSSWSSIPSTKNNLKHKITETEKYSNTLTENIIGAKYVD
jgi:hypothetical protein